MHKTVKKTDPLQSNFISYSVNYFSFTCITPVDISVPNTLIAFSPAAQSKVKQKISDKVTLLSFSKSPLSLERWLQVTSWTHFTRRLWLFKTLYWHETLWGKRKLSRSLPTEYKVAFYWETRISDFTFKKSVLNLEIQIQTSWIFSLPFGWEIRKRICKTVLVNSGLFVLIMRARARPLFIIRTVSFKFRFGFPNGTVNRKSKNRFFSVEICFWIWRFIANPKSGF